MPSAEGIKGTGDLGYTRKYDIADVISLLDVNRYPLLAILTNAGYDPVTKKGEHMHKKEATDPEFKWFEDTYQSKVLASVDFTKSGGGNYGSFSKHGVVYPGDGTMYFADFQVGDVVIYPETGWVFEVTAIMSNGYQMAVGNPPLGAETVSDKLTGSDLWIIGNANEEGSGLREIKSTVTSNPSNYTQIFKTPIGITDTARNTKGWTKENDFDYQTRKKAVDHMIDIEKAFWYGVKHEDTSGTHPKRFTGGILSMLTSYATPNVDTEAEFETWLESAFAHGNVEKYLFASAPVISMINSWVKGKLETLQKDKTYGIVIHRYESPHGTVNIINDKILTGAVYGNYAIMLDMECLTYRYLSNRDTKLKTNVQDPDEDSRVDQYLTECGLHMEQESRHAIMSKSSL